MADET